MLTGISYEAALVALAKVDQKLGTNGLYFTQLKKAAKGLGIVLKNLPKGRYSLTDSVGILSVRTAETEHAVILFRGTVIDPDGGIIWDDFDAYAESSEVKIGSLLVIE